MCSICAVNYDRANLQLHVVTFAEWKMIFLTISKFTTLEQGCPMVHTTIAILYLHNSTISTYLVTLTYMFCHLRTCRAGIQSVFNLQQAGEHKNCGPGIEESSGFSYRPDDLMSEGC